MAKIAEVNHEYFEELGALSALGQITPQEYGALKSHLIACAVCRARQADFMEILHEHLPLLEGPASAEDAGRLTIEKRSGVRRRFLKRAYREGLRFSDEALRGTRRVHRQAGSWIENVARIWQPSRIAYGLALAVLCMATGLLGILLHRAHSRYELARNEQTRLTAEITRLQADAKPGSTLPPDTSQAVGTDQSDLHNSKQASEVLKLGTELKQVRRDYASGLERVRTLDEQLENNRVVIADLRSELVAVQSKASGEDKLREAEAALQKANGEIARLTKEHAIQVAALASQQSQIRELTDKLYSLRESSDRSRDLLATTQEIRELMGARNLHIIDVADVDSRGTRKPFGRVFYTEGRSLVFYAYDLEKKRKSVEKFCFQAWGQVESKTGSIQNLGVFYADDQAQNRWVLKYDDPTVLARIDSVFVTVEPVGGSITPKGQQLMYAYLKANPNHP
ncbi:MAG TPA: hypothetical protein VMW38_20255 [Terriglobia bacterium]|nr:hypothetical protein [Terriglobia bacterium]